jgi:lipopolysaccharide transport system ATP-binding protein
MEPIVRVEKLGKRYRRGAKRQPYGTLRDTLVDAIRDPLRRRTTQEEFWALRDVSFEIGKGQVVGIVGRNGAGKSTLLKLLSRITEPTEGRAELYGRVASLLEVGTGFHGELSGRENIFLNGAILGMRREEIRAKFDAIVAFAEVQAFLETPVKYYSSGMYMRLAFAVAAHLEPEILVVDEVLAVGDAEFQKKCLGKMSDIASHDGRTILFVSHNMSAVRNLCSRVLLLNGGRLEMDGPPAETIQAYLHQTRSRDDNQLSLAGRRFTPKQAAIVNGWLEREGQPAETFFFGDAPAVVIEFEVRQRERIAVELVLRQADGLPVAFAPSGLSRGWEIDAEPGSYRVTASLPKLQWAAGEYALDLILCRSGQYFIDYVEGALYFTIEETAIGPANWQFQQSMGQGSHLLDVDFRLESIPS